VRSSLPAVGFQKWLRLSRPRFWIYVLGPFLVGLAAGAPSLASFQQWILLAWGLYFVFPANLLIYGINDIFDWETDRANAKKIEYETLVPPDERPALWRAIAFFNAPFLLLLAFTPRSALLALAAFFFFSIFYSAPPIRAKTKPILDSVFNTLYICPAAFAYLLIGGSHFSFALFAAATAWAMAMHAYSAIPDIVADRSNGLYTVATFLGARGTIVFCAVCYALAALVSSVPLGAVALGLGAIYLVLMVLSWRAQTGEAIFGIYRWFPLVNTVAGFLLFWSVMLQHHGAEFLHLR
jgi:4-hydroxybenzoate polyprenyltransferase